MNIDIHLNKNNHVTLKKLCRRLFVDFKSIKVKGGDVIFKKKWYYFKKMHMSVVDLVFLHIPKGINELYQDNSLNPIFEYNKSLNAAVRYFGVETKGEDIIQFLQYAVDNMDMSISLNKEFEEVPISLKEKEEIYVEETYTTRKNLVDSITYFYNLTTEVIQKVRSKLDIVYNAESAYDLPRIRGPDMALLSA